MADEDEDEDEGVVAGSPSFSGSWGFFGGWDVAGMTGGGVGGGGGGGGGEDERELDTAIGVIRSCSESDLVFEENAM